MPLHRNLSQMISIAVFFLLAACSATQEPNRPQPQANVAPTDPIDLPSTATAYPNSLRPQDANTQNQIRNTLAHYPLALDGKNFDALDLVFTKDAVANFSAPFNVVRGLGQIQLVLKQALAPVLSQHTYGTQVVEILDGQTAKSVTYFTAAQFGTGGKTGKVYYSYGQYQDNLVRTGAQWRIKHRNLVYMGPGIGDISVFSNP